MDVDVEGDQQPMCPTPLEFKYRMLRVTLDGLDVGVVETSSCLAVQLEPVRLNHCNIHGAGTRCSGVFGMLPGVHLKQLIRPLREFRLRLRLTV